MLSSSLRTLCLYSSCCNENGTDLKTAGNFVFISERTVKDFEYLSTRKVEYFKKLSSIKKFRFISYSFSFQRYEESNTVLIIFNAVLVSKGFRKIFQIIHYFDIFVSLASRIVGAPVFKT